jgi:hypothetical protein
VIAERIAAASSGVTISSASMERIQSVESASSARFFCGPKPGQSRASITRARCASAMPAVASVLPPSTTTISSAKDTAERHWASRAAAL